MRHLARRSPSPSPAAPNAWRSARGTRVP